jgi:glutathione S-transferase
VLVDGAETLFESNVIIEYLLDRYPTPPSAEAVPLAPSMTRPGHRWDDLKTLATIETFADTLVNVRHGRNEGRTAEVSPYMARQEARMNACLDWLEAQAHREGFWPGALSAMDIGLVCPLAYAETRGVFAWRGRPRLEAIYERTLARASFAETGEAPAAGPAGQAARVGGPVPA